MTDLKATYKLLYMLLPIELIRYTLDFVPNLDIDIKRETGLIKKIDLSLFEEIKKVCRVYDTESNNVVTNQKAAIYKLPYYEQESSLWNINGCLIINIIKRHQTAFGNSSTIYSSIKTICNCCASVCQLNLIK